MFERRRAMTPGALLIAALIGVASCGPAIVSHGATGRLNQLGSKRCTFGPSYWCDHVSKSSECGMTRWCIDNVWQHRHLPEDTDDVCSICKEMVKEARDQLNSNETQEELKEVLEGSCNLIPIHIIAEECDKLVDDFIPELTEMLSSQMNPQVVCQTAGLCNSARIDRLLEERSDTQVEQKAPDTCATCRGKMDSLKTAVTAGGQQQLLDHLLPLCRDLGSFSDACAADLATHIGPVFQWLRQLDSEGVCLMGNVCPGLYQQPPLQLRSVSGPAVDCDLCIHIVKHWRDILVANTTKEEFKEILDGICSKTKAWAPKCTQLVDEYYVIIYDFLVNQLRAHSVCKAIGLCSQGDLQQVPVWITVPADSAAAVALRRPEPEAVLLAELTPASRPHKVVAKKGGHPKKRLHSVKLHRSPPHAYGNDGLSHTNPLDRSPPAAVAVPQQLPLVRLGLPDLSGLLRRDTALCDLCEFALRQLQTVLEDGATEDEISEAVGRLCDLLPVTLTGRCHQFVTEYGSFVIQMLAQEIDPTEVCPALRLCPQPSELSSEQSSEESLESSVESSEEAGSSGLLSPAAVESGEGCAICEYAMNTLLNFLKDKKTEDEIREGLDRVCEMLPRTVSRECQEFVNTFLEEIIDMVVSGMTADQVCITLGLCSGSGHLANDLVSNSIHAVPLSSGRGAAPLGLQLTGLSPALAGLPVNAPRRLEEPLALPSSESSQSSEEEEQRQSPGCILCEFVMMQLKLKLDDNTTDEEIEAALKTVCGYMPASVRDDCAGFVDEYGAALLAALKAQLTDPDSVCREISLCTGQPDPAPAPEAGLEGVPGSAAPDCPACRHVVTLYSRLVTLGDGRDPARDVTALCAQTASARRRQCFELITNYGAWIRRQLEQHVSPHHVCIGIDLCPRPAGSVHLLGGARCLWGPDYICQDEFHARACDRLEYCIEHAWNTDSSEELP